MTTVPPEYRDDDARPLLDEQLDPAPIIDSDNDNDQPDAEAEKSSTNGLAPENSETSQSDYADSDVSDSNSDDGNECTPESRDLRSSGIRDGNHEERAGDNATREDPTDSPPAENKISIGRRIIANLLASPNAGTRDDVQEALSQTLLFRHVEERRCAGDFDVVFSSSAIRDVCSHLASNTRREMGGLLIGRELHFEGCERIVFVTRALPALEATGTPTRLMIPEETWSRWDNEIDRLEDDGEHYDRVGWYHSHPHMSIFLSAWDLDVCSVFPRESHIALVVDPVAPDGGVFVNGTAGYRTKNPQGFWVLDDSGDDQDGSVRLWRSLHELMKPDRMLRPAETKHGSGERNDAELPPETCEDSTMPIRIGRSDRGQAESPGPAPGAEPVSYDAAAEQPPSVTDWIRSVAPYVATGLLAVIILFVIHGNTVDAVRQDVTAITGQLKEQIGDSRDSVSALETTLERLSGELRQSNQLAASRQDMWAPLAPTKLSAVLISGINVRTGPLIETHDQIQDSLTDATQKLQGLDGSVRALKPDSKLSADKIHEMKLSASHLKATLVQLQSQSRSAGESATAIRDDYAARVSDPQKELRDQLQAMSSPLQKQLGDITQVVKRTQAELQSELSRSSKARTELTQTKLDIEKEREQSNAKREQYDQERSDWRKQEKQLVGERDTLQKVTADLKMQISRLTAEIKALTPAGAEDSGAGEKTPKSGEKDSDPPAEGKPSDAKTASPAAKEKKKNSDDGEDSDRSDESSDRTGDRTSDFE